MLDALSPHPAAPFLRNLAAERREDRAGSPIFERRGKLPGPERGPGVLFPGLSMPELRWLLDPQRAIRHILRTAVRITGARSGSFVVVNPNTGLLEIEDSYGLNRRVRKVLLRMGEGVTGWVALTARPQRIGDVRKEPRYVSVSPRVLSEMAVPIEIHGQVAAVINVDHTTVDAFSAEHEALLVSLADEASEWLRQAWEIEHLKAQSLLSQSLVNTGKMISSQQSLTATLEAVTLQANKLMKTRVCSVMLLSPDDKELILRASNGASVSYVNKPNLKLSESVLGVVVTHCKPLAVLDVQSHEGYQHLEVAKAEGLRSLLAVPIIFNETVLGVLSVYTTKEVHRFSNGEIKALETLADLTAIAIERGTDLTYVVETEEKLRASERLSALGLLAAEIAHEIRNPLCVMQMLFHALAEAVPMDPVSRRDADIIAQKMKHLNRIVDQVLNFARSSEPAKELISAPDLLEDIGLLIRHKLAQEQIEMRVQVAPETPAFRADRSQVEQVLLNLILNGMEAMPGGGILRLSATPEFLDDVPCVMLSIRDNGHGMTERQVEHLFAPFLTTKQKGTGIGLAMVLKIVENHQGKVLVDSRPGRGTVFRVYFPAETQPLSLVPPAAKG
ncbi:histidine kinase [Verrucomicrobia bacterium LW23]|nr:histidine kinase [Verrucomicrobia bacterium LW23]